MKVLKPQRLGLLQRGVEHHQRCTLVVSVLAYVPLGAPRKLMADISGGYFSSYGAKLDNKGWHKETEGIKVLSAGPTVLNRALQVLTAGVVSFH